MDICKKKKVNIFLRYIFIFEILKIGVMRNMFKFRLDLYIKI